MGSIELLGLLLTVALVTGLIGFVRTVWFISIGYAASMVLFTLTVGVVWADKISLLVGAQLLAAAVWGTRLGSYLVARERNPSYQEAVKEQTDRSQALSLVARLGIWTSVSLLYVCMFAPVVFLAGAAALLTGRLVLVASIGVAVMWLGLIIETLADQQKSRLKAVNPNAFASEGLYRWVRYPNYLGEILFWLGNFVAGIVAYAAWWHWLMALIGIVCIVLIMLGSTKRMEFKQDDRYGGDPKYDAYVRSVPVLLPWVPLYTLKNIRVYLE